MPTRAPTSPKPPGANSVVSTERLLECEGDGDRRHRRPSLSGHGLVYTKRESVRATHFASESVAHKHKEQAAPQGGLALYSEYAAEPIATWVAPARSSLAPRAAPGWPCMAPAPANARAWPSRAATRSVPGAPPPTPRHARARAGGKRACTFFCRGSPHPSSRSDCLRLIRRMHRSFRELLRRLLERKLRRAAGAVVSSATTKSRGAAWRLVTANTPGVMDS